MKFLIKHFLRLRQSLNQPNNHSYVSMRDMSLSIPKIIHQTYFSKNLPVELQRNINQLKLMNPNWSYKIYDDKDIEDYIKFHYPELFKFYCKINPIYGAARADFFRYLLIYNEGGLYLDIKSSVSRPLDEIIRNNDLYLLSHWKNEFGEPNENAGIHERIKNIYGEFQQWHIASARGHPFLRAVINNVCHNIEIYNPFFNQTGKGGVLNVTGPIAYTLAITPYLSLYTHRLERSNRDYNFVYSIYSETQTRAHLVLYKNHYTNLDEPIVNQPLLIRLILKTIKPVKPKILNILNKFI